MCSFTRHLTGLDSTRIDSGEIRRKREREREREGGTLAMALGAVPGPSGLSTTLVLWALSPSVLDLHSVTDEAFLHIINHASQSSLDLLNFTR
jgi:hypothetical protein